MKMTCKSLAEKLENNALYLRFTKVNGEEREMICTRSGSMIPDDKHPSGTRTVQDGDTALPVFDLGIKEWRSVRPDSLKEALDVSDNELATMRAYGAL